LHVSGGDLVLESDATGDASLIDYGSLSYGTGSTAKVERYLTNSDWHLVSSPVSNAIAGLFQGDYLQFFVEATNAWSDISVATTALTPVKGFSMWTMPATTPVARVFDGSATNTGNQSISITKNGEEGGWNLVGNPYPSRLDWDEVVIPNGMNGAFHIYDPSYGTNGNYRSYIAGGGVGNTATQYISSGQGFIVRATGGSGTLLFTNDARVHQAQNFYKSTSTGEMLLLKVTGSNNLVEQTAIRFIPEATQQVDRLFDVYKMTGYSPDVPVLYTLCNGEKMAINSFASVSGNETVPVYFESGIGGNYVIQACELQTIDPQLPVYLEDVLLNEFIDLRANPEYSFTYTTGGSRLFRVHFSLITGSEMVDNPDWVKCSLSNNILQVSFDPSLMADGSFEARVQVYAYNGQLVLQEHTTELSASFPLSVGSACYAVKISYGTRQRVQKVFQH
jgi:hypothetical protein